MAGHDVITSDGKKFFKEIEKLKQMQVRVGYQRGKSTKTDEDGKEADYCDIALWNELGTDNGIPSRPFLRQSVDNNASRIDSACKSCMKEISNGGTAEDVLKKIGVME